MNTVRNVYFKHKENFSELTPEPFFVDQDEIDTAAASANEYRALLIIGSNANQFYKLHIRFEWFTLSQSLKNKFPATTPNTPFIYTLIAEYAVVLIKDVAQELIRADAAADHPHLATHPHHIHFKKGDAMNFDATIDTLLFHFTANIQ